MTRFRIRFVSRSYAIVILVDAPNIECALDVAEADRADNWRECVLWGWEVVE